MQKTNLSELLIKFFRRNLANFDNQVREEFTENGRNYRFMTP